MSVKHVLVNCNQNEKLTTFVDSWASHISRKIKLNSMNTIRYISTVSSLVDNLADFRLKLIPIGATYDTKNLVFYITIQYATFPDHSIDLSMGDMHLDMIPQVCAGLHGTQSQYAQYLQHNVGDMHGTIWGNQQYPTFGISSEGLTPGTQMTPSPTFMNIKLTYSMSYRDRWKVRPRVHPSRH